MMTSRRAGIARWPVSGSPPSPGGELYGWPPAVVAVEEASSLLFVGFGVWPTDTRVSPAIREADAALFAKPRGG
jgi:hypothetical protein